MKLARGITITASVMNLLSAAWLIFIIRKMLPVYRDVGASVNLLPTYFILSSLFAASFMSFIYNMYLGRKTRRGESAFAAVIVSLFLLFFLPALLMGFGVLSILRPLYDLTGPLQNVF